MAEFEDVRAFHEKFGLLVGDAPRHLTRRKLAERANFMLEELNEFVKASGLLAGQDPYNEATYFPGVDNEDQDLAAQADALADLVYVALGTAIQLGLPWTKIWDDVHAANMRKERGVTARGHAVDVRKPPGWVGPRGAKILVEAGYDRDTFAGTEFVGPDRLRVEDRFCVDDADYVP